MDRLCKSTVILLASISISLLAGCSSIVRKPEINGVKKVAIISVYADEMVPWTGGRGRVENFDTNTKNRVALQAFKAYAREFQRLGWQPVSLDQVAKNDFYKKEFGPQQVDKTAMF